MIIGWTRFGAISVVAVGLLVACDSGTPSKTRDEIAADSALASDLALANRDTLLVDSIGEYRPPDQAERDTAGSGNFVTIPSPTASQSSAAPATPPTGNKTLPAPKTTITPPPVHPEPVKPIAIPPATNPAPAFVALMMLRLPTV